MRFDALVIGAGTAGAVTARQLHRAGLCTLLVGRPATGFKPGESLPGAARPLLRDLDLLTALEHSAPLPHLGNLASWDSDDLIPTDFIQDPNGPGWHLDRPRFDACLLEAARNTGVPLVATEVKQVERDAEGWRVGTDAGEFTARFLVDASGRHGVLRRRLGLARVCDTPLVAVYASGPDTQADRRTVLEATAEGWWYSAPLPGGRRVAVLHTDSAHASQLVHAQRLWHQGLAATRHLHRLCDSASGWTPLSATGAGGTALRTPQGQGWLAVGDAALAFDPLSSQGIFNALYTALRGAQAVVAQCSGDTASAGAYSAQLQQVRQQYLLRVRHYYQSQPRWPQAPFWRLRRDLPSGR
ncbi:tryptophan 7-halogenase [Pseudomonas sp. NPDC089401]|uniref:tryptophan 7-halogenase n=1 Tax=Pseudomonas sp. NPDC089401 TaxID=3364462 RepID=UPI0038193DC5